MIIRMRLRQDTDSKNLIRNFLIMINNFKALIEKVGKMSYHLICRVS